MTRIRGHAGITVVALTATLALSGCATQLSQEETCSTLKNITSEVGMSSSKPDWAKFVPLWEDLSTKAGDLSEPMKQMTPAIKRAAEEKFGSPTEVSNVPYSSAGYVTSDEEKEQFIKNLETVRATCNITF